MRIPPKNTDETMTIRVDNIENGQTVHQVSISSNSTSTFIIPTADI